MSAIQKLWKRTVLLFVNHFLSGTHFFSVKAALLRSCQGFELARNVRIVGPIHCCGRLTVGENSWIGHNLSIEGNGSVTLGANIDVAPNVTFYTGSHIIGDSNHRAGEGFNASVIIGDGTWICGSVTFLPRTQVGNGCVIAAGTVVI